MASRQLSLRLCSTAELKHTSGIRSIGRNDRKALVPQDTKGASVDVRSTAHHVLHRQEHCGPRPGIARKHVPGAHRRAVRRARVQDVSPGRPLVRLRALRTQQVRQEEPSVRERGARGARPRRAVGRVQPPNNFERRPRVPGVQALRLGLEDERTHPGRVLRVQDARIKQSSVTGPREDLAHGLERTHAARGEHVRDHGRLRVQAERLEVAPQHKDLLGGQGACRDRLRSLHQRGFVALRILGRLRRRIDFFGGNFGPYAAPERERLLFCIMRPFQSMSAIG